MKKKGFIAGILVLSMLLMGTGYAFWTDKLTIETKADTGDLDVKFVDLAMYGQYDGIDNEKGWAIIDGTHGTYADAAGKYTDSSYYFKRGTRYNETGMTDNYRNFIDNYTTTDNEIALDNALPLEGTVGPYTPAANASDKINITLTDLYPGYATCYQADIVNVGTLTARLSAIKASVTGSVNDRTKDMLGISMELLREYAGESKNHVDVFDTLYKTSGSTLGTEDFFTLGGAKFLRLSALSRIASDFPNSDIFVQPDDCRMDVYFAVAMDPDANGNFTTGSVDKVNGQIVPGTKNDELSQDSATATITIDFLWDQFNVGVDSTNNNYHLNYPNTNYPTVAPTVAQ